MITLLPMIHSGGADLRIMDDNSISSAFDPTGFNMKTASVLSKFMYELSTTETQSSTHEREWPALELSSRYPMKKPQDRL